MLEPGSIDTYSTWALCPRGEHSNTFLYWWFRDASPHLLGKASLLLLESVTLEYQEARAPAAFYYPPFAYFGNLFEDLEV